MKTIDEMNKENAYIKSKLATASGKLFMNKEEYDHLTPEVQKIVDNSPMIEIVNPTYVEGTAGTAAQIIQESINPEYPLRAKVFPNIVKTTATKSSIEASYPKVKFESTDLGPIQDFFSLTQNMYDGNPTDGFICKECGLHLEDWVEIKIVDDEEKPYEFEMRFCPNCGKQIQRK